MRKKVSHGVTLLELLVVLVVVGVLSSIALPQFTGFADRNDLKKVESILMAIRTAERYYYLGPGNGGYTGDLNELRLDQAAITNDNKYDYGPIGTPVNGFEATEEGGGPTVKSIDFDTGVITTP